MSNMEISKTKTFVDKIKDIEEVGLLYVKGYSKNEIATLMSLTINDVKDYINEYKIFLLRRLF